MVSETIALVLIAKLINGVEGMRCSVPLCDGQRLCPVQALKAQGCLTCNVSLRRVALGLVLPLSVACVAQPLLGSGSCFDADSLRPLSNLVLLHVVIAESTASLEDSVARETVVLHFRFFHLGELL